MTQTTPTRDEAVLDHERIPTWPPLKHALWMVVTGEKLNDGHYINAYQLTDKLYAAALASAPAPASGGVDAVKLDKAAMDWAVDCAHTAGVSASRDDVIGIVYSYLSALTPAATPVSEAGGDLRDVRLALDDLRTVATDESYKPAYRLGVQLAVDRIDMAVDAAALAKPASSPAGGDVVREALHACEATLTEIERDHPNWMRDVDRRALRDARAALSQSTSAGRGE